MADETPVDIEISKHLKEIADDIATRLKDITGRRVNFSLIVYSPIENSRMNYISNGDREDVYTALKSLLKGWEDGMPDIPGHDRREHFITTRRTREMAEIKDDAKLKLQMVPNPNTGEVEALITIKGVEDEHGWFMMRSDLVNFLAHGKVTLPHAQKKPQIEIAHRLPGDMKQ